MENKIAPSILAADFADYRLVFANAGLLTANFADYRLVVFADTFFRAAELATV